ncbi:hypothetical protein [Accumulibacter sp.]|uniref:hypothetical protein n=1 Tax=Accumulibacter sp. TaxID=2053492 RepID=UPI0025E1931C|nr:hypothetical protein [Accumulibacter sp.]MCM8624476.1 hypothetical protein [Accumulibacter sp.]
MSDPSIEMPHDPQVSGLYRRYATDEPSAAVDRRILALAHAAVSKQRPGVPPSRWWLRWRTPLALATTAALTLTLSILHERQTGERAAQEPVEAPAGSGPASVGQAARGPVKSGASVAEPRPLAPSPAAKAELRSGSPAAADVRAPARTATERPGEGDRRRAEGAFAGPAAQGGAERETGAATNASPAAGADRALPAAAAPRGLGVTRESARAETAPAPAPSAPSAARTEKKAERSPAAWLEEIRRLRREGQIDEADHQLAEFRRLNPDFPVPEDLLR